MRLGRRQRAQVPRVRGVLLDDPHGLHRGRGEQRREQERADGPALRERDDARRPSAAAAGGASTST